MKKKQVTVNLEPNVYEYLSALSDKSGMSVGRFLRAWVGKTMSDMKVIKKEAK